jgi:shikimate dehydrogenase
MGWAGFNCSLPHKVEVIRYLDGLGESAKIIGAVNCVVRREGRWIGENTDGKGFLQSLQEKVDPRHKSVVIFGAGGAARAISVELALAGAAQMVIVNRSDQRARALVDLLNEHTQAEASFVPWHTTYDIPSGADIVVNATSIGLFPHVREKLNVNLDTIRANVIVADVIPNPPRTQWIMDAEARGCVTIDGLGMLVNQGVIGIKYWTGIDVDALVMRRRLEEVLRTD